jgi:hypothetical protein
MNGKKRWAESGAFCLLHIIDRGSGHTGRGMGLLHGAFYVLGAWAGSGKHGLSVRYSNSRRRLVLN